MRYPGSLLLLAACAAWAPALELGQAMPANADAIEWVQGAAVDPAVADAGKNTLVVFWFAQAVDSPRALKVLGEFAAKHKNMRVAALNPVDNAATVREFLKNNPCAGVSVGVDTEGATLLRYFPNQPAGQSVQLPVSFLADGQGRTLWTGSPTAGLAQVIEAVAAGDWTMATTAQLAQARNEMSSALKADNAAAGYLAIRKLTKLETGNPANYVLWHRLAVAAKEFGDLDAIFLGWMEAADDQPDLLLMLANTAMNIDNLLLRRPRVANLALQQAYRLRSTNARFVLQVAAAYQRLNNLPVASKLLGEAITLGASDILVGLSAAQLYSAIYGPKEAVKLLERWKVEPNTDAAKALAEHMSYYRLLVELEAQPLAS